jgi:hypothetical protein
LPREHQLGDSLASIAKLVNKYIITCINKKQIF